MATEAKKKDAKNEEVVLRGSVEIKRHGEMIVLPDGMTYDEACTWLQRRKQEEEQKSNFMYTIDAFPLEGAYALSEVFKRRYGFTSAKAEKDMFGNPIFPTLVGIEVGIGRTEEVPWGKFEVPGIEGWMSPSIAFKDGRLQFQLVGEIKNKHKDEINELARLVREQLETASIYRGQAIRVHFCEDPRQLDPTQCPHFIDTAPVDPNQLVFSETIEKIVRTTLFTPIERTADCKRYKVPLKRGVLLEGPYGVGKSLTADVVAKKCVENGWTFIGLKDVKQLAQAIEFARSYQPALIFAEDIDRAVAGDKRTVEMDAILNTIDGIGGKDKEIFVVLTTNDVSAINRAMLRPGRLDAVVTVEPPDGKAAIRLARNYSQGMLDEHDDFSRVEVLLSGRIPAVIREIVERSKLAAISRMGVGEQLVLKAADLEVAAETMNRHLALLKEKEVDNRSNQEKAAELLGQKIGGALVEAAAVGKVNVARANGHKSQLEGQG